MATTWPQLISRLITESGPFGPLSDSSQLVPHRGFEPLISALRVRGMSPVESTQFATASCWLSGRGPRVRVNVPYLSPVSLANQAVESMG